MDDDYDDIYEEDEIEDDDFNEDDDELDEDEDFDEEEYDDEEDEDGDDDDGDSLDAELLGSLDAETDSYLGNSRYSSYGMSVNEDDMTEEEKEAYEAGYESSFNDAED